MNRAFDVRKLPQAVTLGYAALGALATVVAAAVHVASYGPDAWGTTLSSLALGLSPLIFVFFFLALGGMALGRVPPERLIAGLPRPVIGAGALVFVYVWVNFFLMIHLLPGRPEDEGARGFKYVARLFTGHEMIFLGFSAAVGYGLELVRAGRIDVDAGPRDQALEQRPLPWPFSRTLTLQTMLSAAEAAERLKQPIPQGFFSTFGRYGVRGEATPAGFRLELGGMQSSMVYAVGAFEGNGMPTFIRILVTFKRWVLIGFGISVLILPIFWLLIGFPWPLLLFLVSFGVGGNLIYGIAQMNSLLNLIKRATGGQEIALG